MIFNEKYDMSLYLILKSDKKNRKIIIDFLEGFPFKLYEELLNIINSNYDSEEVFENSIYTSDGKFCYSYTIFEDEITLSKQTLFNGIYNDLYDLTLAKLEDKHYNFDGDYIGNFTVTINTEYPIEGCKDIRISKCDEREYVLVKTPIGYIIEHNLFDEEDYPILSRIPAIKVINMKKLKKIVVNDIRKQLKLR